MPPEGMPSLQGTIPAGMPSHAVCVTGLQRSFPEISGNIRRSLEELYDARAQLATTVAFFGVRPANDSWHEVREALPPLTNETLQRPCGAKSPAWFSVYARSHSARVGFQRAFVMSLCDMAICLRELVEVHEAHAMGGRRFLTLARLRLDLAWEVPLRMPNGGLLPHAVYVPRMNAKAGINDKWALGHRLPMGVYLARVEAFAVANRLHDRSSAAISANSRLLHPSRAKGDAIVDVACIGQPNSGQPHNSGLTECRPQFDEHTAWQGSAIVPHDHQRGKPYANSDAHSRVVLAAEHDPVERIHDPLLGVEVLAAVQHAAPPSPRTKWTKTTTGSGTTSLSSQHELMRHFVLTSEGFLQWALWRQNVSVVHVQSWMFCKYKDALQANSTPRTCVPRMRKREPCQSLICTGGAVDCVCRKDALCMTYDKKKQKNATSWYCADVTGDQLDNGGGLY